MSKYKEREIMYDPNLNNPNENENNHPPVDGAYSFTFRRGDEPDAAQPQANAQNEWANQTRQQYARNYAPYNVEPNYTYYRPEQPPVSEPEKKKKKAAVPVDIYAAREQEQALRKKKKQDLNPVLFIS